MNDVWLDYSDYTQFSRNRKQVYLTLKDGGFGDADGIENGIIVDPLAFGSESDPSSGGSDSPFEDIIDGILPNDLSCFISTIAGQSGPTWTNAKRSVTFMIGLLAILLLLGCLVALPDGNHGNTEKHPDPSNDLLRRGRGVE